MKYNPTAEIFLQNMVQIFNFFEIIFFWGIFKTLFDFFKQLFLKYLFLGIFLIFSCNKKINFQIFHNSIFIIVKRLKEFYNFNHFNLFFEKPRFKLFANECTTYFAVLRLNPPFVNFVGKNYLSPNPEEVYTPLYFSRQLVHIPEKYRE